MSVLSKSAAVILTALLIASVYSFTPLFVGAAVDTEAVADTYNGTEGSVLEVLLPGSGVLSNDVMGDGANTLSANLVTAPSISGAFSLSNDGTFSFMPTDLNFSGDVTFTYTASDDLYATSSPVTVTLHFADTPDAPIANNQTLEAVSGIASSSLLTYTDIDLTNSFTFSTTSDPSNGSLTLNAATGEFTYTPANGFDGSDSFMWEVFDGTATSAVATVTVNVAAAPDPEIGISFIVVSNNGVVATTSDTALFDGATTTGATTTVSVGSHTLSPFPLSGYTVAIGGACAADGTIMLASGDSKHCVVTYTQQGSPAPAPITEEKKPANGPISTIGPAFGTISNFNGLVLGASTSTGTTTLPELPAGCTPLLNGFMRRSDMINSTDDVKKLQSFLRREVDDSLEVTGTFGPATEAAVRAFQQKNATQILSPWGLNNPTGFVYLTTQRWINLMSCPNLDLPMPKLVPYVAH
jgi:hypothetical protein